jgi:uncharacterized protein Smg (DUF494 family)
VGERVLEIVVLLISRIRDHQGQLESFEDISSYLKSYGFTDNEIRSAYSWVLEQLQSDSQFLVDDASSGNAFRVLTGQERRHFNTDSIGYLLQLRYLGIITDTQMEQILERGALMGPSPIDMEQIKILIGSVLFQDGSRIEYGKQQIYFLPFEDGPMN